LVFPVVFISGYDIYYIPDAASLPEEYPIEFDIFTYGMKCEEDGVSVDFKSLMRSGRMNPFFKELGIAGCTKCKCKNRAK